MKVLIFCAKAECPFSYLTLNYEFKGIILRRSHRAHAQTCAFAPGGVPAAVGAACPLPPEKGQSTIAHWDDPALCRTGDPVLGNIRISMARCLRGILLLMAAPEKCAGRFPINLSGAFLLQKNRAQKKFRARFDRSLN